MLTLELTADGCNSRCAHSPSLSPFAGVLLPRLPLLPPAVERVCESRGMLTYAPFTPATSSFSLTRRLILRLSASLAYLQRPPRTSYKPDTSSHHDTMNLSLLFLVPSILVLIVSLLVSPASSVAASSSNGSQRSVGRSARSRPTLEQRKAVCRRICESGGDYSARCLYACAATLDSAANGRPQPSAYESFTD